MNKRAKKEDKLKIRCEFLGINHRGLSNVQRKEAIQKKIGDGQWTNYLKDTDKWDKFYEIQTRAVTNLRLKRKREESTNV